MKKFNANTFNKDSEISAIVNFLVDRWNMDVVTLKGTSNNGVMEFVEKVYNAGFDAASKWIDRYALNSHLYDVYTIRRRLLLKNENGEFVHNDVVLMYLYNIMMNISDYVDSIFHDWDYSDFINLVQKDCKVKFNGLTKLKPNTYKEFTKDYSAFSGMEEYADSQQQIDEDEFDAVDSGTASSFSFPVQISLPHVAYDDIHQGRHPLYTLICAIATQGMVGAQKSNDAELKHLISLIDILQEHTDDSSRCVFPKSDLIEAIIRCRPTGVPFPENATFVDPDKMIICSSDEIDVECDLELLQQENTGKADKVLAKLKNDHSVVIHNKWLEQSNELGYKVTCAVVEYNDNKLAKLRFNPETDSMETY